MKVEVDNKKWSWIYGFLNLILLWSIKVSVGIYVAHCYPDMSQVNIIIMIFNLHLEHQMVHLKYTQNEI